MDRSSPPLWELTIEWIRVVGLAVAAVAVALTYLVEIGEPASWPPLIAAGVGMAVYVVASFASPSLRSEERDQRTKPIGERIRTLGGLLAFPPGASARRLPRVLVAILGIAVPVMWIIRMLRLL